MSVLRVGQALLPAWCRCGGVISQRDDRGRLVRRCDRCGAVETYSPRLLEQLAGGRLEELHGW